MEEKKQQIGDELQENPEETEEKDPAQIDYDKGKEHLESGDQAMAAAQFHNAFVGFEQNGNEKGMANASDKLGDVCMARQDYEKALLHFQKSFEICDKFEDQFSLLALRKKMAAANRSLCKYEKAVSIYMDILDVYSGHNNPGGAVEVLEELSATYLEYDDRPKAADALRTAASIHTNFKHERTAEKLRQKAQQIEEGAV